MEISNRAVSSFLSFLLLLFLFLFASLPCWKPAAAAASVRRSATACNETADSGRRCGVEVEEDAEEFQFDSEINRRLLSGTSGINYGALNKDKPTCSSSDGKPYNCAGKSPNPGGGRTCNADYYRC